MVAHFYSNATVCKKDNLILNCATERMFLQRIGDRYPLIHKLLQEHFAAMSEVSAPLREER